MADVPVSSLVLDEDRTQELHDQLEPQARQEYLKYILSRTPADLQDYMKDLIEEDFTPEPPSPSEATVTNGQTVTLQYNDGSAFPINNGTVIVANSAVTAVRIAPASSMSVVRNGDVVPVVDMVNGSPIAGSPGSATVTLGILQDVRLSS